MTADHDAALCKRLAEKLDLVRKEIDAIERYPDFCCEYGHGGLLEKEMAQLGWKYSWSGAEAHFTTGERYYYTHGANRLHASALAAYMALAIQPALVRGVVPTLIETEDEPTGLLHSCFEFDEVEK